jgi:CO/xanthine dehydrogenase FAD-binding subunit
MRFEKFVKPKDSETALQILKEDPESVILGGTTFLRLSDKKYSTGIDLSELNLNYIKEKEDLIEIGAYTTLRDIEINPILNKYYGDLLPRAVTNLVGVQFRNNATIGGAVFSRLGFSEITTALLVLDCQLEFEDNGTVDFQQFISNWNIRRDILKKIIIRKEKGKSCYKMFRNSSTDLPILSVAVSNFKKISIAVGTRPAIAKLSQKASDLINSDNTKIEAAANLIIEEFNFGDDLRAKSEYRNKLAPVLVKRALQEVLS